MLLFLPLWHPQPGHIECFALQPVAPLLIVFVSHEHSQLAAACKYNYYRLKANLHTDFLLMLHRYSSINSLSDLHHAITTQKELQTVAPSSRWDTEATFNPNPQPGQVISRFGTYVDSTYAFDSAAFGLQQGEALLMDPQQRLLLEETLSAFHDADYTAGAMGGSSTGVFVG